MAPAANEVVEDDDVVCSCASCGSPDEGPSMVLCDFCDAPWHLFCLEVWTCFLRDTDGVPA